VQANSAVPQSPQSRVSVRYSQTQTAGNSNVLAIGWNDATSRIVSVTDSAGNAYRVAAPTSHSSGLSQAMYYAANIAGGSGNTVTVTFSAAVPFADVRALEYAGLDRSTPLDASVSASGSSRQAATGSLVTSASGDLLVAGGMTDGTFTSSGATYTVRQMTQPDGDIVEDAMAGSGGSYSASAAVKGDWILQLAAFRAAD
jgi:hypothetical protein